MGLQLQTDFGESLDLTVSTKVLPSDGVCYVMFKSGKKLIRKVMFGYGPEGFKRADDAAQSLRMLTGARIIRHDTDYCDRTHSGYACNTNDIAMNPYDRNLR